MKKLSELKPEEKRILAAEACGIIVRKEWHGIQGWNDVPIPDYGSDLNAMAEAEDTLTDEEWERLEIEVMGEDPEYDEYFFKRLMQLTAAQRLDAFLLAKGLAAL